MTIDRALRKQLTRKQLLMAASTADEGPWCSVSFVKIIEIQGAPLGSLIKVHVFDENRLSDPDPYLIKVDKPGPFQKTVNIPRGRVKITRSKGKEPITVYALCGS